MSQPEIEHILSTVKTMLKNRNFPYREFAKSMEMSESGVKKLLNGTDLSMSRLVQISNVLAVPLTEIVKASQDSKSYVIRLNTRQQDFFVENMQYFYFFSTLVEWRFSRDDVQEMSGLSEASVDVYMRKLAELELFELADSPRPTVSAAFIREARKGHGMSLMVGPRVNQLIRNEMCTRLLDTANTFAVNGSDIYDEDTLKKISEAFMQRRFTLTVDSINALRLSLRELINTYSKRSSIEQSTHPRDQLINIGWSYVVAPFDGAYTIPEL